jgi:hypothetical protein
VGRRETVMAWRLGGRFVSRGLGRPVCGAMVAALQMEAALKLSAVYLLLVAHLMQCAKSMDYRLYPRFYQLLL